MRLLIFLPAILIPACASSSPTFHMMYSAHKLSKQGDDMQPWRTPFPIFSFWPDKTLKWAKHRSSSDAGSRRESSSSAAYSGLGTSFMTTSHLPAQKTTKESLIPAHCVLLLHPAELSACFLFYPQHCLSWCTAVDKWISSASYVNLQTSEGRKHLNSFTCIFITEFRVVQAMIKRRSTTNRVRAK